MIGNPSQHEDQTKNTRCQTGFPSDANSSTDKILGGSHRQLEGIRQTIEETDVNAQEQHRAVEEGMT
jgi:hypothetical protein